MENDDFDRHIKKIADGHDEKANAENWSEMQFLLKANYLQNQNHFTYTLLSFTAKIALPFTVIFFILFSGQDHFEDKDALVVNGKADFGNSLMDILREKKPSTLIHLLKGQKPGKNFLLPSVIQSEQALAFHNTSFEGAKTYILDELFPIPIRDQPTHLTNQKNTKTNAILEDPDHPFNRNGLALLNNSKDENNRLNPSENDTDSLKSEALFTNQAEVTNSPPIKKEIKIFRLGVLAPLLPGSATTSKKSSHISVNLLTGISASSNGFAFSGLSHTSRDYVKGLQLSGLFNTVENEMQGLQVAGIANQSKRKTRGGQVAGLINISGGSGVKMDTTILLRKKEKSNFQMAAFANLDFENTQNLQASLVMNFAKEVDGTQIALLMNIAEKVKGVQLGLVNICDEIEGAPIGLVSVVRKNGLKKFDFWMADALLTNIALKLGVKQFYNILALGTQFNSSNFRFGVGYGVGSEFALKKSWSMNAEFIAYHINEDARWTKELNMLNQFRLNFVKELGARANFFIGPTLNILVSDFVNDDDTLGSRIAPYTVDDRIIGNTRVRSWFGFSCGISIK